MYLKANLKLLNSVKITTNYLVILDAYMGSNDLEGV